MIFPKKIELTLNQANDAYSELKKNRKEWLEYQEEISIWDATLGDGLNMQNLIDQIQPGQTWRHYKNKDYRIIAVSCYSEDLSWYVVYEALYDNPVSKIWHRSLDMFLESIEIDGKTIPRFKRIEK